MRVGYTLIQDIASTVQAYHNCVEAGNSEWESKHRERLEELQDELPSGSGIDCGTKIDIDQSNGERVVLTAEYHHMNEGGMYDGWTEHTIYVTPAFDGIHLRITGRDRNQIKEYLYDVYSNCLQQICRADGIYADDYVYSHYIERGMNDVADLHASF